MIDEGGSRRVAGTAAVLGAIGALGSSVLLLLAIGGSSLEVSKPLQAFGHPELLLSIGHEGATLLRWGFILDMFGYYLLLAPAAIALWSQLQSRGRSRVSLYTLCGLAYMLVGAVGATTLAAVVPPIIDALGHSAGPQRETASLVLSTVVTAVYVGLWNTLEATLAAAWWLGIGFTLLRARRGLGALSILLGACWLLDAVGHVVDVQVIWMVPLNIVFALYPIWTLWLGIALLRPPAMPVRSDRAPASPLPA